jgi:hypothetical protein
MVIHLRQRHLGQAPHLDPEVLRRKHIRMILRSLSGAEVHWPTTTVKHKTKEVGHGEHRRTLNSQVTFTFQVARAHVGSDSKDVDMAPGLTFSLHYADGVGSAGGYTWTNEPLTLGAPDIGVSLPGYGATNAFHAFMALNAPLCAATFPAVVERMVRYRRDLLDRRQAKRDTSPGCSTRCSWTTWPTPPGPRSLSPRSSATRPSGPPSTPTATC